MTANLNLEVANVSAVPRAYKVGTSTTSRAIKTLYGESGSRLSLKQFARNLLKEGNQVAKDWFAHKHGNLEKLAKAARQKNKGGRIALEKQATKNARRKTKPGMKPVAV